MNSDIRVPPNDPVVERAVLAGVIQRGRAALDDIADVVTNAEMFYLQTHRHVWDAAVAVCERAGEQCDALLVAQEILRQQRGSVATEVYTLINRITDGDRGYGLVEYARQLRSMWVRRQLIGLAMDLNEAARVEQDADELLAVVAERTGMLRGGQADTSEMLHVAATRALERGKRTAASGKPVGPSTGLVHLDDFVGGLIAPWIFFVAARPGHGKSALAVHLARVAASPQKPALIVSLEMDATDLGGRALAAAAGISGHGMLLGHLTPEEWAAAERAVAQLRRENVIIEAPRRASIEAVCTLARRHARKHGGLGLIVVDYAGLVHVARDRRRSTREQDVADISTGLTALAKELSAPLVACVQLNRDCEKREDKRPQLSDMRESGQIEQDADVVIALYRDEKYNPRSPDRGVTELLVRKNRHGPCGEARVNFDDRSSAFTNREIGT